MRKVSVIARFPGVSAVLVAAALATTTAGYVPDAHAQGAAAAPDKKTKDAARKAYGEGEKAFNAGKYEDAYAGFSKAYGLIPTPHAEYWIAATLDKQGKDKEALEAYEKFLGNPGAAKVGDDKVADAKKRVEELKSKMTGEVSLSTVPPGATVTVDGAAQMGETPMIVRLKPGSHKVVISAPGYQPKEMDIEVKAGEKLDQNVELVMDDSAAAPPPAAPPEPVAPPPQEPPKEEPRSKVPAYVTLGIAGASAVVGTIFGIQALSAKSDFNDKPTSDAADDVERNALIADMAFGVAITLGVTGVVLLTSGNSEPAKEAKTKVLPKTKAKLDVAPYFSPNGGGAAARLSF